MKLLTLLLLLLAIFCTEANAANLVHNASGRENMGGSTATINLNGVNDTWSAPTAGDWIVCTADVRRAGNADPFVVDTPTGFTLLLDGDVALSSRHSTRVWYKYPAIGDESSIVFSSASGTNGLNSWEAGCDSYTPTDLEGTIDTQIINLTNQNTATTTSSTGSINPSKNTFAVITGWSVTQGQDFFTGTTISDSLTIAKQTQDATRSSSAQAYGILMQDTVDLTWTTGDTGDKNNSWALAIVEAVTDVTLTLTGGAQQEAYSNVEVTMSGALGCGDPTYCRFSTGDQVVPTGTGLVWNCPLVPNDYAVGGSLENTGFGARGYTLLLGCGAADTLTAPIELNVTRTPLVGQDEMRIGYTWGTTGDPQEACRAFTGMAVGDDIRYVFQNGSGQIGPGCQMAIDSEQAGDVSVDVALWDESEASWQSVESTDLNTTATLSELECIDGGLRADCSLETNVTDGTLYWDIDNQCQYGEEDVSGQNAQPVSTRINIQTLYALEQGTHCVYALQETSSGSSNMMIFQIDLDAPGSGDLEFCDHVGAYYPTGNCPPELTSPTVTNIAATTVTVNVTTDTESVGDMYWCVSVNATRTPAEIKAGTGCTDSGTQAAGANPQTAGATGLVSATSYYAHWVHTAAFEDSNVATSTQFTTL